MQVTKIDQTGGGPGTFILKINVLAADIADNSEIDTGGDLDAEVIVEDFYVYVNTADTATTKTLDVGLLASESGGDANGFGVAIATGATGIIRPFATYTDGTNQNYVSASTIGAFLFDGLAGGDVAGTAGVITRTPHLSDSVTAKSVSITHGDASGATALDCDLYFVCRNAVVR
jgi:hypothetical protein